MAITPYVSVDPTWEIYKYPSQQVWDLAYSQGLTGPAEAPLSYDQFLEATPEWESYYDLLGETPGAFDYSYWYNNIYTEPVDDTTDDTEDIVPSYDTDPTAFAEYYQFASLQDLYDAISAGYDPYTNPMTESQWNYFLANQVTPDAEIPWIETEEGMRSWQEAMDLLMSTIGSFDFSSIFSTYTSRYKPLIDEMDRLRSSMGGTAPDTDAYFSGINVPDISAMQAQVDQMLAGIVGGPTQADMDWARKQVAINNGYADWDTMSAEMNRMRPYLDPSSPTYGQGMGLTPEERAQYEKYNRTRIRDQEQRATTMLEAVMANTGSAIKTMAAADEINSQITDQQVQYDFEIQDQDMAMKFANLDRMDKYYSRLIEAGTVQVPEYLEIRQTYVMDAIGGYMDNMKVSILNYEARIAGAGEQAGLALEEYNSNIARIIGEVDAVYKMSVTQLGIDEGILDRVTQMYEMTIMPKLDMLNTLIMKKEIGREGVVAFFSVVADLISVIKPEGF